MQSVPGPSTDESLLIDKYAVFMNKMKKWEKEWFIGTDQKMLTSHIQWLMNDTCL